MLLRGACWHRHDSAGRFRQWPPLYSAHSAKEKTLTVGEFLVAVRRYAGLLGAAFLVAAAVAIVVTQLQARSYQAEVKLLVGNLLEDVPEYEEVLTAQRLSTTYAELLQARSFAESVAEGLTVTMSVDEMLAAVEAITVPESSVITVSVMATDPGAAAAVANAYGNTLVRMTSDLRPDPARAWTSRVTLIEEAVPPIEDENPPSIVVGVIAGLLGALGTLGIVAARSAGATPSERPEPSTAVA